MPSESDEIRYEVIVEPDDASQEPYWDSFDVEATSEAEAVQKLREEGIKGEVADVAPYEEELNVTIVGDREQTADFLEDLDFVAGNAAAEVSITGPGQDVEIDGLDDSGAHRVRVDNWADVKMRVTGLAERVQDDNEDGMDISAANFADESSTVEFIAGDKVLARIANTGEFPAAGADEWPDCSIADCENLALLEVLTGRDGHTWRCMEHALGDLKEGRWDDALKNARGESADE